MIMPATHRKTYLTVPATAAAKKGFHIHLIVYICVMSGLFLINASNGSPWWVVYPLIGWGFGVVAHAILALRCYKPSSNS